MSESLPIWRTRVRWFAAEFLVIVTGVLVALGLNALYQRGQEARNERTYLSLLSRDLRRTERQLAEKVGFETAQLRDGLVAYRALSAGVPPEKRQEISARLGRLGDRRTMILGDATYQDLLSTGNLRLIRNRQLRDRIVEYYAGIRGDYEVMNRNNWLHVDGLYMSLVIGKGLIKPGLAAGNTQMLADAHVRLAPELRPGYIDEVDYLWSLSPDSREWAELKTTLLARIRAAAISEQYAGQLLARTRTLRAEMDAEGVR